MECDHRCPRPKGICSRCLTEICRIGLEEGCYCLVGFPYEKRCSDCRDNENRLDDGYCVCVPTKLSPRKEPDLYDDVVVELRPNDPDPYHKSGSQSAKLIARVQVPHGSPNF